LAAALRDLVRAETVEPDLGTDFFGEHELPPPVGTPESADWAFWCWVDSQDRIPVDPDWAINKTRVPDAWAFSESQGSTSRGAGIVVFQPDTGVVPQHVEVPPNAHLQAGAVNFIEPGQPPVDPMTHGGNLGHGTGTSSVLASPEDHKIRGAAPNARL